jgi:nicotinate-nucleotide adenylyltransferase
LSLERIGLFGGTFDPIHKGHVRAAVAAQRTLKLDRVIFLPVRISPLKTARPRAGSGHRWAMLKMALRAHPDFKASRYDLDRPSPAYTIDTLRHFKKRYPRASFFLIMGTDSLAEFSRWKRFRDILSQCRLAVVRRPGFNPGKLPASVRRRVEWMALRGPSLSSTQLRRGMIRSRDVARALVPSVDAYIRHHSLYATAS